MALTSIETIAKAIEPVIANTRLTSAPTVMNLYARDAMRTKMDTSLNWSVDLGGGGVSVEPLTQDGANTAVDNIVPASLRIGRYRIKHQFPISRVEIEEAAMLAPAEVADLFQAHVIRGINKIMREFNRLVLLGTGSAGDAEIRGLDKIIDNATAYAGIDPTAIGSEAWKAIVNTNATNRALTNDLLLSLLQTIQEQESFFDMIVTSPAVGRVYNKLFNDLAGGFGMTPDEESNGLTKVELGTGGRYYQGIPLIEDPMLPAGRMYFLNSMDMDVFSFSFANSASGDMAQTAIIDPSTTYGLNVHLAELPSNNSAVRKFELYVMPQFRVFNRKSVAVLDKITTP